MDGVITNTMSYHFDAWLEVLSEAGIKIDCYDVYKREGQPGLTTIRELSREQNKKISLEKAKALLHKKEGLFKRIVKIKFVKGASAFLRNLHSRHIVLSLVTGTSRHEMEKILPKQLRKLFSFIVTGDEVKHGKPNPEPFLKAVAKINFRRNEIVVIENAPFGIEAAKRAGLFCAAMETSLPKTYLKKADIVVKSFAELKKKINF